MNGKVLLLAAFVIAAVLSGCSRAEPVALRATVDELSNPDGDVLVVLQAIEQRIDDCMEAAGFPEWQPGTGNLAASSQASVTLPQIERISADHFGYIGDFGVRTEPGVEEPQAGEIEAAPNARESASAKHFLGNGSAETEVTYVVPGSGERTRLMAGCQGAGYRGVLTEGELPRFLAGEVVVRDLLANLQRNALERTAGLDDWQLCMSRNGIETTSPFRYASHDLKTSEYATIDEMCRLESGLEESYDLGVQDSLGTVTADRQAVLTELEGIASNARSRLESSDEADG